MRDVGDGPEKITNLEQLEEVKRLAKQVLASAVAMALVATAPFVFLP